MKDTEKSREQLIHELQDARQRIAQLERLAAGQTTRVEPTERESGERFKMLFETANEGIIITDIETGSLKYSNTAFCDITGYRREELMEMPLVRLFPPVEHDFVLRQFALQAAGESTGIDRMPMQVRDGRLLFADITASLGLVGGRECVINFIRDVTGQKLAEDEIRKFKSVADGGCFAVLLADTEGSISYANPHLAELLGTLPGSLLDRPVDDVLVRVSIPKAGSVSVLQALAALNNQEIALKARDGAVVPVLASGVSINDERGRLQNVGLVAVDIARQKQAEARLGKSLLELETSRNDVLSIVNQLRPITMIVDRTFETVFLSQSGREMLGLLRTDVAGRPWHELLPVSQKDRVKVKLSAGMEPKRRKRIPVEIKLESDKHYWMEIDVRDDPRGEDRRILFVYDTTEVHGLRQKLDRQSSFHHLIGRSERMEQLFKQITEIAGVDWTVLIEGETGAGKELVARAIHDSSGRADHPFVPVNCAGLTDSLLGSQLFGHKRGSFTGAVSDQKGVFEAADGGTVFLDEIGDISTSVQTSLLRVLETHEVTRIGESTPHKVDVRIITATNRDLQAAVRDGRFRADLVYRIRAARIAVPSLRERRSDIPLLASEFLSNSAAAAGKKVEALGREAMKVLLEYDWPGNVRELKGALEYAALHCDGPLVNVEDLPPELTDGASGSGRIPAGAQGERERFLAALEHANGNRTTAARLLGMSRATFYRRLGRLGIQM